MKTEYISKILESMRFIFPDLTFQLWEKDDKGKLLVSTDTIPEKSVVKFNPELLEMQLDAGNTEFFKDTIKMFAEIVDRRYVKKMSKYRNRMRGTAILLTSAQIRYGIANSKSCNGAAKALGVDLRTFKKYAIINGMLDEYNLHRNPSGAGVKRPTWTYNKIPLVDIIKNNKHPNYDVVKLKKRLISECIFEEKCDRCGYDERRDYDQEVPIILDFIDGNKKNKHVDNMHFLCYNCTFLIRPITGKVSLKHTRHMKELLKDIKEQVESNVENSTFDEYNPTSAPINKDDIFDRFNRR